MIELFYYPTPNGRKISIMLEEAKIKYKITLINLNEDEHFKKKFLKINPYGKIPAIIDHEKDLVLIESGAILIYLAKKSGQFLPKENETRIFEWLMFQTSNVGPNLGQLHHFYHFNPGKSLYSEERFHKAAVRLYTALNNQLKNNKYFAGDEYSIADIAMFPWIARHDWHMPERINLRENYKFLINWYERVGSRLGVIKGYDCLKKGEIIPEV